jgi:hypothetical protein
VVTGNFTFIGLFLSDTLSAFFQIETGGREGRKEGRKELFWGKMELEKV